MKRVFVVILLISTAIYAAGWYWLDKLMPPAATVTTLDPEQGALAARFLDLLDAGRYEDALAMTTPEMREGLGGGKLEETWAVLPKQLGPRRSRSAVRGEAVDGYPIVTSTLSFPMLALDARVVFDADNRISGFWIVPAREPAPPQAATHTAESGAEWHEVDLAIGVDAKALPATLTLPNRDGPFAGVVLVHGSGPHDRDETIGPNKPFRDLAHGLAAHGIAVLRYVKRTQAHPQAFADGDFTVDEETVDDALIAVAMLRTQEGIDARRVFVAGHSLGAMMAPRIGQRDPRVAGLILLAAPALPLEDTIVRQAHYLAKLDGHEDAEVTAALASLEQQRETVRHLESNTPREDRLMFGLPPRYWLDLNGYDPVAVASGIAQPLLILQGERDYQVTPQDDFALWKARFAGDPRATLIAYPLLGHTFMPGSEPPGPGDYQRAAHVDAGVISDIAVWIHRQSLPESTAP